MDIEALEELRPALERFAQYFDECIKTEPSRKHFRRYIGGQLSDLVRKCVEPMALRAGIPPRTLQQFLSLHRWDEAGLVDCLQRRVAERHGHAEAIALIDETSFPKKGDKTPGVQRQHCGASGKIDNCMVSVHLGYVAQDFHAILDSEIFLPKSWIEDPERCEEAGIPEGIAYRTKQEIALEQLQAATHRGVKMTWLCADELYGRTHEFRLGAADLGLTYVVEIPCNLNGWLASRVKEPDAKARRVDELWSRGGPRWEAWHVKDTERGPAVWEARVVRFHPQEEKVPGDEQWLIIARNVLNPSEIKYFLCNASAEESLATMLGVAFYRWHIERLFRESKNETGLDHFEGRVYQGWTRHLLLTSVSILFLSEQRKTMRTEKHPFTLEQIKQAVEVQLDPDMPPAEVRRHLEKVLFRLRYHQRRNATARKSHTKTRLKQLAEAGVDMDAIRRCTVTL